MDTDKIKEGVERPYPAPKQAQPSDQIDPEKFKKTMKVGKSQEAEDQNKRTFSKEEEEGEVNLEEPSASSDTSFSEHMENADPSTSIFDKQSEGMRKEIVDRAPPSSPATSSSEPMESANPSTNIFDQRSGDIGKKSVNNIPPPSDSSLLASQPKTKNLEAIKKKKKKAPTGEVQIVSQKRSKKKEASNQTPPKKPPEMEVKDGLPDLNAKEKNLEDVKEKQRAHEKFFQRLTPEEIRNQKIKTQTIHPAEMGAEASFFLKGVRPNQEEKKKGQKENVFFEASREVAGTPLPPPHLVSSPIPPIVDPPIYTKLSPELFELFEKISASLLIQQEKGDTTTTLNLSMAESVFDKTQIIINQYRTAPMAYNIQLIGNPKSVQIFRDNLEMLEHSFKQGNFAFDVQILNPILANEKTPSHLIRRKEETGKEQEKKQK